MTEDVLFNKFRIQISESTNYKSYFYACKIMRYGPQGYDPRYMALGSDKLWHRCSYISDDNIQILFETKELLLDFLDTCEDKLLDITVVDYNRCNVQSGEDHMKVTRC